MVISIFWSSVEGKVQPRFVVPSHAVDAFVYDNRGLVGEV